MTAKPTINWFDPRKGRNVDGSVLPSDTPILLTSRHHYSPPSQYVVFRQLPKPFWSFWGTDLQEVTRLDASEFSDAPVTLGSRYFSEPLWNLPAPPDESDHMTFRAWTDTGDANSGSLGSARIWLEEMSSSGRAGASLAVKVSTPALTIGPDVTSDRDFERHWRVRVVEDPWIEISVLQGASVVDHLRTLEDQYDSEAPEPHQAMQQLPADTMTYFVDHPLQEVSLTHQLQPDEPITLAIKVQDRQDLRAAICLRVRNLEDGSITTTPPIFLTHFRDRLFASDVTIDLFRREAHDLLMMLGEERLDVERLANRLDQGVQQTWSQLIAAAEELGADSVGAAALFISENAPVFA
jgi:hypothetical protein